MIPWVGQVLHDVAYISRLLQRQLTWSLAFVLTTSLGIAATTTLYAVADRALLHPLPFDHADRLILLAGASGPPTGDRLSYWGQAPSLAGLAECRVGGASLLWGNEFRPVHVAVISASFFSVFDVLPDIGRPFFPQDETPGQNRILLLSHARWADSFGKARDVVGRDVILNGIPHTIIGIMPEGFRFPGEVDVWIPRGLNGTSLLLAGDIPPGLPAGIQSGMFIGRLKPGAEVGQAHSQLTDLFKRLEREYAQSRIAFGDGVRVRRLQEIFVREFRPAVRVLLVAAALLLALGCANAANLLLAQEASRAQEFAIRISLGAGRGRILRQVLTESVFLTLLGSAFGVLLAYWGVNAVRILAPAQLRSLASLEISPRILLFAVGLSVLVGIVVGLMPALKAGNSHFASALAQAGMPFGVRSNSRVRGALVVGQLSLALVLLISAGLAARTLNRLSEVRPGFSHGNKLTVKVALPQISYREWGETLRFQQETIQRFQAMPGISAAATVNRLPLSGGVGGYVGCDIEGEPAATDALYFEILGDYFQTMKISIIAGRAFNTNDSPSGSKVVIINRYMADRFWPDRNPLGQQFLMAGEESPREIVGVVGDVKFSGLGEPSESQVYVPGSQPYGDRPGLDRVFVLLTDSNPNATASAARSVILSLDRTIPIMDISTMEEIVFRSSAPVRFRSILLGTFACAALLLASLGVYGVVSYTTESRLHEFGVRMVLGARPRSILLLVFQEATGLILAGMSIGGLLAFAFNRLLGSLLFGISPSDPLTFAASALVLSGTTLGACWLPARRASRIAPAEILRHA